VTHGRATGEKALQSHLISEAYQNARAMASINTASRVTNDPVELVFITDEIPLPVLGGKTVCDVLALRRDGGRFTPVLIELKDCRQLKRLVEQVQGYSALMDEHAEAFGRLYEAVLGRSIRFDGATEKWIVWPPLGLGAEPKEDQLLRLGIRCVGYRHMGDGYAFTVGPSPVARR
jgi:hypothetical protein